MTSFPKTKADVACLAFLRAVDPVEADTFGALIVQHFNGVAVEDGDDAAGEICRDGSAGEKDMEECCPECDHLCLGRF